VKGEVLPFFVNGNSSKKHHPKESTVKENFFFFSFLSFFNIP